MRCQSSRYHELVLCESVLSAAVCRSNRDNLGIVFHITP